MRMHFSSFIPSEQEVIPMAAEKKILSLLSETLNLAVTDQGEGRAFLLLHGGAGPASVSGLAEALSQNGRVVVPVHPGFNGEPRPEAFRSVDDLVGAYLELIEKLGLTDVTVIGNSLGGWIAAELALRHSARIARIVLLNAVGIDTGSPEKTIVDPMSVDPAQRLALSFHNPARFGFVPSPAQLAAMAENQKTLRVYAGQPFMHDPALLARLAQISVPALVAWGESDRIVDLDYGRRWAEGIPGARFVKVAEAGHFPQIERLDEVVRLVNEFTREK